MVANWKGQRVAESSLSASCPALQNRITTKRIATRYAFSRSIPSRMRGRICQAKKTPSSSSPVKEESESTVSSWISSLDLEAEDRTRRTRSHSLHCSRVLG